MITYKLQTGEKIQDVQFPTGYNDLTFSQLLRLRLEYSGDIGHLLDILTGIPRSIWMNLPMSEANRITNFLQWIINSPLKWEELVIPKTLHYKGTDYTIPKDLGFESFGQKIVLEAKIAEILNSLLQPTAAKTLDTNVAKAVQHKSSTQLISLIPYIVAVYMQPRVTGKPFDETEVQAVEMEILNCRAVEVYPIGNFFIRSLLGSVKSGKTPSQDLKQKLKTGNYKKKQVLKKSKKKRATS